MDKSGAWRLAPAYDITFSFNPQSKWISRHQLSVNGKREAISDEDILSVAKSMNIKKPGTVLDRVKDVLDRWKEYAGMSRVDEEQADYISKLLRQKP